MYRSWSFDSTKHQYVANRDTVDRLPAGLYDLDNNYGDPIVKQLDFKEENNYFFKTGPMIDVLKEIAVFRQQGEKYKKLGVTHKRGLLLHGPAGNGKTGILSVVIKETIENDGLAIKLESLRDFADDFSRMRQIEKDRLTTILIEDMEQFLGEEEDLLELLDGFTTTGGNIVILATTNKIEDLPARIKYRPSRIDTLIEIGYPSVEQRAEYLTYLLMNYNKRVQLPVDEIAHKTTEFSLAMLKELVIGIVVYEKQFADIFDKLNKLKAEDSK